VKVPKFSLPKGHLSLAIILLILGVLLSTSFNTHRNLSRTTTESRKKGLIDVVNELETERDDLRKRLISLNKELSQYEKKAADEEGVLASYTEELDSLKLDAGLSAVTGPGVQVTMADSPQIPIGKDPNNYIIHDYDLRVVVNALWAGGAEAITINNQRLISTSSIRCAGNTILVNYIRLASPYEIKAIGSPDKLVKALEQNNEVKSLLKGYAKAFALDIDINEASNLKLPGYKGSIGIKYARVDEGD